MAHVLCTMNANNLYLRYRFGSAFPGDVAGKSRVEDPGRGYLPPYDPDLFELFNETQRRLTALAIKSTLTAMPDLLCLQEIESLLALRKFNEEQIKKLGRAYPYAVLIDSRDFRQIDVALLSRLEILRVRTHVDDLDPKPELGNPWLFSRDCLEVDLALNKSGSLRLTLFINHLKSQFISGKTPAARAADRKRSDDRRRRQAERVRALLHERFPGPEFGRALFAVVGDLNDHPGADPLRPLVKTGTLVDALARITPESDRWTHWFRSENTVGQLDYLLLSPALDAATTGAPPRIERRGVSFARVLADGKTGPRQSHFVRSDTDPNPVPIDFQFRRFGEVSPRDYASDHCPVFLEIP